MSLVGTVTAPDGLRVRTGPSTDHDILGALAQNEDVALIAKVNEEWWGVESRFGLGFVHGAFVSVSEVTETVAVAAGAAQGGAALTGVVAPPGTISILNPLEFDGTTEVTSASPAHHRPFGGSCSCDLDVHHLISAGRPVRFNVAAPAGIEVRGVVKEIGFTCGSHRLEDGGLMVKLNLQKRPVGGAWEESGAWVLYGHLDPVAVSIEDVVEVGGVVGALGPAGGGEYRSDCASASHVHIEATRAECVVRVKDVIRNAAVIRLA